MKKMTLPLVMIASLATLVACGTKPDLGSTITPVKNPTVTGIVVTPNSDTGSTLVPVTTASGTASSAMVVNRKEVVTYKSPAEEDMVEFDVTVTDGLITQVTVTPKTDHEISKKLQTSFSEGVSAKVLGKKAKDLDVDAIGGASLTTAAFESFVHSL